MVRSVSRPHRMGRTRPRVMPRSAKVVSIRVRISLLSSGRRAGCRGLGASRQVMSRRVPAWSSMRCHGAVK